MDLEKIQDRNILAWIIHNGIKTERGLPFDFDKFSFMIDPYNDWTPLQGVRKASQCGWSTMTNLKLFYAARFGIPGYAVPAANVIYTLPSDSDVNVFVPSKTNQLIKQNPVIADYLRDENGVSDVDSIQRKKIGNSMVYFKGTRSKTAAIMLTSDLNIHDESDRSEKSIIDEYESRTAQSVYKGRWVFSNPSAPNMPADLMFLDSDQKHWFIKCEHCGYWQYLDWFKLSEHEFRSGTHHCFIDDENGLYICGGCSRPITDDNRKRGKWVKKYFDKDVSGYWVSHFMYSWISAKDLVKVEKKKSKAYFMNFVRGLPYVGSDVTIDAQTIVNNIVLTQKEWKRGEVAMGVDNGDIKHYVIGDAEGIFEVGTTRKWEDIELLIQKYEPTTVIDLNPYPNKPRELANKYRPSNGHRWRVYCSFYTDNGKDLDLITWGTGDRMHMVYPDRNKVFDDLIAFIANGNLKFFRSKSYFEEYIAQWETMYRADLVGSRKADEVSLVNPNQIMRGVWLSSTGNDHFAHATLYYYVALSKIIGGRGQVLTSGTNVQAAISQDQGPVITVPESGDQPGTIKPMKDYLSNIGVSSTKKSSSVSGNM